MSRASARLDKAAHRIREGKAKLGDFLSKSEITDAMVSAEWRIIHVFAVVPSIPGRVSRIGVNLANLASYVQREMEEESRNAIYSERNLPKHLRSLPVEAQKVVVRYVLRQVHVRVLARLIDEGELQCIEGEWLMSQKTLNRGRHSRRVDDSVCRRG